jgi:AraC-like DNA-binding protein
MRMQRASASVLTSIATMLLPAERALVDAAGEGLYCALHRESMDDVLADLKVQRVNAVLVSVTRFGNAECTRLARMVREFPRVPAVALLTQLEPSTPQAVLAMGQSGIRSLVDVRLPTGWRQLRTVLAVDRAATIEHLALGQLALDLMGVPDDCWRFFEALFKAAPAISTVRDLAISLDVIPSTLMSRFFRARLPAPKRYLAMARLTQAAYVFENPGLSVASVANALDYSSPQSFGRHIRTLLRMTAVEFRQRYDGMGMIHRFREELVLPFISTLRTFTPLSTPIGWVPTSGKHSA